MHQRLLAWTKAHPFLAAVLLATALFWALTVRVHFTFMADDWAHLAAAQGAAPVFTERFSAWLGRVPVWSLLATLLFGSRVLETTWAPIYLAFVAHAAAVALLAKWLLHELAGPPEAPTAPAWVVTLSTAVFALYPNGYEIFYWPTCMPYALGGLFLAAALYVRPLAARAALFALAFLTYETFVLPALVLMLLPTLISMAPAPATTPAALHRRAAAKAFATWCGAVAVMLLVRGVAARWVGAFTHQTNFAPQHMATQLGRATQQLWRIHFWGLGTDIFSTTALAAVAAGATLLLWRRWQWRSAAALLLVVWASTALYWLLNYSAMRAIYGAQLLWIACLIALVVQASRTGVRQAVVALALLAVGAGFVMQQRRILAVKEHNSRILAAREHGLKEQIERCGPVCTVTYPPLDAGLKKDWVLPPDYWPHYLERIALIYGRDKQITFVLQRDAESAGEKL